MGQQTQHHGSYLAPFPQTMQELHQGSPLMQVQPTRLFYESQQQPTAQIADSLPDLPEFSSSLLSVMLPKTNQHNDSQSCAPMETQMINCNYMYGHDKISSEKGSYPIQDYQI